MLDKIPWWAEVMAWVTAAIGALTAFARLITTERMELVRDLLSASKQASSKIDVLNTRLDDLSDKLDMEQDLRRAMEIRLTLTEERFRFFIYVVRADCDSLPEPSKSQLLRFCDEAESFFRDVSTPK